MAKTPNYDVRSLQDSIEHRKRTIKNLEQAIALERTHIATERRLIETIERKAQVEEGITIDASAVH